MKRALLISLITLVSPLAEAVTAVNPTGVNVNASGVTTVFLSFQGTQGQTSTEAFWCGEITVPPNTVTTTNPCVPGTLFGRLPQRVDLSQQNNDRFTDIMTIPASVSRRAMQSARAGDNSSFFYVRKFVENGVQQYIAVTCRMTSGGARTPFALTEVRPYFFNQQGKAAVHLLAKGESLPDIGVDIQFNGSGRLKGRWELVRPGDTPPESFDLLPEASLPIAQRGLQKRYIVVERFDVALPPTGKATIKGPSKNLIANNVVGPYQLLFRVEATRDKEADSNDGVGTIASAGAAGFPMPVLRYYVGTEEDVSQARRKAGVEKSLSQLKANIHTRDGKTSVAFRWKDIATASVYKIEFKAPNTEPFSAVVLSGMNTYTLPPWILQNKEQAESGSWRVIAFNESGKRIASSSWQELLNNN